MSQNRKEQIVSALESFSSPDINFILSDSEVAYWGHDKIINTKIYQKNSSKDFDDNIMFHVVLKCEERCHAQYVEKSPLLLGGIWVTSGTDVVNIEGATTHYAPESKIFTIELEVCFMNGKIEVDEKINSRFEILDI